MVKRTLIYFWSVRYEFTKYFIVGFSGLFIDMGTLILFTEAFGIMPWVAVVMNQAILLTYNFTLNKYWSFRNKALPHRQIVRYGILAGWNYLFSVTTMFVFNARLDYDYRAVRILSIAVMVSWNFFLYKYWVYRNNTIHETQSAIQDGKETEDQAMEV